LQQVNPKSSKQLFGIFTPVMKAQKTGMVFLFMALLLVKTYQPPLPALYTFQQPAGSSLLCDEQAMLSDALLWSVNMNGYAPVQQNFSDLFSKHIATDFLINDVAVFQKIIAPFCYSDTQLNFSSPAIYIFIRVLLI
jgi:hypothetical protein